MDTRLGSNLYRVGLAGAVISVVYTINVIWMSEAGSSFLPIPERYVSREEMLATVAVGVALTLIFWGSGAAARYFVNKAAVTKAAEMKAAEKALRSARAPSSPSRVPKPS
jgi:hypothetical protein